MSSPEVREGDRLRAALVYGLMIATTVIIYLVIREYGERLAAPAPSLGSEPFGPRGRLAVPGISPAARGRRNPRGNHAGAFALGPLRPGCLRVRTTCVGSAV